MIRIYYGPMTFVQDGKQVVNDSPLRLGAQLALNAHLYVDGWTMYDEYKSITDGSSSDYLKDVVLAIKFLNNVPIAIAWCDVSYDYQAYCKPMYRRQGHCTALIQVIHDWCKNSNISHIKKNYDVMGMSANAGINGSLKFWDHITEKIVPIGVDITWESSENDCSPMFSLDAKSDMFQHY